VSSSERQRHSFPYKDTRLLHFHSAVSSSLHRLQTDSGPLSATRIIDWAECIDPHQMTCKTPSAYAITPRRNIDSTTRRVLHLSSRVTLAWEGNLREIQRITLSFRSFRVPVLIQPIAAIGSHSMRIRTCLLLPRSSPLHSFPTKIKKTNAVFPHLHSRIPCPTTVSVSTLPINTTSFTSVFHLATPTTQLVGTANIF
jgi:hypothetical protein